jgi:hypothetical protein
VGVDTALRQNVDIQAGVSGEYDIEEILKNAGIGGALGGGVAQLGKVVADNAPAVAGAIREGIAELGAGADQRIAERGADSSTTLTSGVDPMPAIDAALSAAGRSVRDQNDRLAGDAMAAQARYFETGNFEPPTAENPVSVVRPTETEPGIIAFHGSGADFDEFRLEMIGTGEGAQAYGYGLYFTDSEDIAKFYRDSIGRGRSSIVYDGSSVKNAREVDGLTDREMILDSIAGEMAFFDQKPANVIDKKIRSLKAQIENPDSATLRLAESDAEAQELVDLIRRSAQRDLEIYESLDPDKFTRGKMYKVGLSPKPDDLLDYDEFFGDQNPDLKKRMRDLVKNELTREDAIDLGFEVRPVRVGPDGVVVDMDAAQDFMLRDDTTVDQFLGNWAAIRGKDNAGEQLLNKYGIPGIKYRASGSRGAATADEAAERNYVIFDDRAVKILEKYGIVGPVSVSAVAASQNQDDDTAVANDI